MPLHHIRLADETDFEGWRDNARRLLSKGVPPADTVWLVGADAADLFSAPEPALPVEAQPISVPRGFVDLAKQVVLHSDPQRFGLLYRLLWRLRAEPRLLSVSMDPDVARLEAMAKSIRRDIHKMRAFVRFRKTAIGEREWYVAWFEPDHHIVAVNAPFFTRRFSSMNWSILTPIVSAHWDGEALAFSPGCDRTDAPQDDVLEDLWRDYYASIFNPARLKVSMMKSEMAVKYWRNLPEAELIRPLIGAAQRRTETMVTSGSTEANGRPQKLEKAKAAVPVAGTLSALREQASHCRACPLWAPATQTVFGEGAADASILFVGEQPGDQEDLEGRPFVGPAGRMFDRALEDASIERAKTYVTNAVKHFKFVPRGKRRIHQKPGIAEMRACRPWLEREIDMVRPDLIVALGATAAQSLFGKPMPIGQNRGRALDPGQGLPPVLITVHPSYLLRLPDPTAKDQEYGRFVEDLIASRRVLEAA